MRKLISMLALVAFAGTAEAQLRMPRLPVLIPLGKAQPGPPGSPLPAPPPPAVLRAQMIAAAGSDTVYFSPRGYGIDANAAPALMAQARWLVANPFVYVRLEGHGGPGDTRDYAIAIGARRANAVRDFLVLHGVAPQRITTMSWGKERPGTVRIGPSVVAAGPRVVTTIQ